MVDEFYTPDSCDELIAAIHNCQDSIKFAYSSHSSGLDSQYCNNEALMESYFNIREACLELIRTYDYYNFVHSKPFPPEDSAKEIKLRSVNYSKFLNNHFEKIMEWDF